MLRRMRGFTLVELMVSILLVALVMGVVVSGMQGSDRDLSQGADRLASTMRFLHDKAATEGMYIKLMLDLEEQSYWVEATRDPYLLAQPDQNPAAAKVETPPLVEGAAPESPGADGLPAKIPPLKPKEANFNQVSDFLLKATKLPEGAFFKDVHVEHLQGPATGGRVSITFFPNGYVEDAVINLRDGDDTFVFSLKTEPLLGKVDIADGYRELGAQP